MDNKLNNIHLENGIEISDTALSDLGFDIIGNHIFSDCPGIYKIFCKILSTPLHDEEQILDRQRIFLDFCKYPLLIDEIEAYCKNASSFYLKTFGKSFRSVNARLQYYLSNTLKLMDLYDEFPETFQEISNRFPTLGKHKHVSCSSLKEELEKLSVLYTNSSFSVNLEFNNGFQLRRATLNDVKTNHIPIVIDGKKKHAKVVTFSNDYFFFGNYGAEYSGACALKDSALLNLCQNISKINSAIKDFFENVLLEAEFYKAALILKKYIKDKNIPFCIPQITGMSHGIVAEELYDLGLVSLTDKKIFANDLCMEKGKILLVSGHNRGGKTTFLKSVGIAQILAQSGLFVPAKKYLCPIYQGLLTHFPSGEDETLGDGKLADELKRFKKDFHILKGGGLALFNESFSTTTTKEGAEIGIDLLRAVRASGSHAIFVTHLMELLEKRNLIGDTLSLTTVDSQPYKIIEGEPIPNIYAYKLL